MALTPANDEAFFREVDDNLRQDRMVRFARRWGKWIGFGVGLALALLAGFLLWQNHRKAEAGADAETMVALMADVGSGKANAKDPRLASLAASPRDGYRALARLTQAELVERTDVTAAGVDYDAIAADTKLPQAMRDLATIRGVTIRFDRLLPQTVVDRLKPLAVPGGPWFGSAAELTAIADLKMNKANLAGPLFAAIARDTTVPTSLRGRAAGMASALGQTVVTAASPAALKE
ncbi:tetratricopeptide repeat protein [Sphingomonas nostoxanthinifaciens]|uniref:tetratricopeptide repeat protein n=1 Tax=Sphingomonas nostoxanthinifaciens TaxID=2872652 RepID=UPI001CC2068E|nr:tetratricopeptide repeat protein [Sphingomonas nostoxanthinifaciens]UAK25380.1 tetratricopeptide repeat protein [Sphingomonas nostoxanthinifaciens]